jgi:carbonic anhydrase/acetyltransferase-like protein (isoleucine patch superfamily)
MGIVVHHGVTPRVHPSVFVADGAQIIGDVELGMDSSVWFNAVLRGDINAIRVGERSNVQDGAVLHVTHEYPVYVGADATVGHQAIIHGCTVEDGSLIGMGAIILDNARIGPYSLVAAGAVVREGFVVPEGMLAAGVPARIVRKLTDQEKEALFESAQRYMTYAAGFRDKPR